MTETNTQSLSSSAPLNVPADYGAGYGKARLTDPSMADNYIAHTVIGDPLADALLDALYPLGEAEFLRLINGAMDQDETVYRDSPRELADFFFEVEQRPGWASKEAFEPGIRGFHQNSESYSGVSSAAASLRDSPATFPAHLSLPDGSESTGSGGFGRTIATWLNCSCRMASSGTETAGSSPSGFD